jgi:hypothetical protein
VIKPAMFVVATGIAVAVMAAVVSIEHRAAGPVPAKAPLPSVDDDPDSMVRAQKLCVLMQNTPEYRTGDRAYRDATDAMCEDQKRDAARLLHR